MNCPACDSTSVSVECGPTGFGRLVDLVVRADEADQVEVVRSCWTCGWRETRVVSVTSVAEEPGEEQTVARERQLNELLDVASNLDRTALEDLLETAIERADSAE